jgi:hypothetical protein
MTDANGNETKEPEAQEELEDLDPINFSDRVIAFLVLVFPFSLFVDRLQALLLDHLSQYVNNMIVLACLVGFLVLVGWFSKRVHAFRARHSAAARKE